MNHVQVPSYATQLAWDPDIFLREDFDDEDCRDLKLTSRISSLQGPFTAALVARYMTDPLVLVSSKKFGVKLNS